MISNILALYRRMDNEEGMSAIEMMLAIAIAGILVGAIAGFLTAHIRSFETTVDVIDVQYEGQLAFNALGKTAMESLGVFKVTGTDFSNPTPVDLTTTSNKLINPESIAFRAADKHTVVFYFDEANHKIIFKEEASTVVDPYILDITTDKWYDFAFNIDAWSIEPGVSGATYADTNNIYIQMTLRDGDVSMDLSNLFKFRNYGMR